MDRNRNIHKPPVWCLATLCGNKCLSRSWEICDTESRCLGPKTPKPQLCVPVALIESGWSSCFVPMVSQSQRTVSSRFGRCLVSFCGPRTRGFLFHYRALLRPHQSTKQKRRNWRNNFRTVATVAEMTPTHGTILGVVAVRSIRVN